MIDAHVHIWRLGRNGCAWPPADLASIHRDHGLAEIRSILADTGVERVVLVQSQESEDDTCWLLTEAATASIAAGVVGWIDAAAIDPAVRLARLTRQGPLVGLRIMAQDRAPEWLDNPMLDAQLACLADMDLSLDLLVRPQHLPASVALATRFPALRMVIDHCAKPDIAAGDYTIWREAIARAAERPNLFCKMSGLITEAAPGAPMERLIPYMETVLDLFGPERLIWGSDWPVINLNGEYHAWLALARRVVPTVLHGAVFGGNACAFYRLTA